MWEEAMTWKLKLSNPFWTGMLSLVCFTSGRIREILETEWGYSTFLNQTDTYV
jgi:hypothetical protein